MSTLKISMRDTMVCTLDRIVFLTTSYREEKQETRSQVDTCYLQTYDSDRSWRTRNKASKCSVTCALQLYDMRPSKFRLVKIVLLEAQ